MMKKAANVLFSIALATSLVPSAAFATASDAAASASALEERARQIDEHEQAYSEGAILVVPAKGMVPSEQAAGIAAQSAGAGAGDAHLVSEDAGVQGGTALYHVDLPEGVSVGEAVAAAEADPRIAHAQPIYKYRLLDDAQPGAESNVPTSPVASAASTLAQGQASPREVPNDEFLKDKTNSGSSPNAWWIYSVKAPDAWELAHSDNRVTVAILDTGINFAHEDLKDNILEDYAWDSYLQEPLKDAPTAVQTSTMAHGSHVAGIVAARANNAVGTAGVSYNANILPICVFHEVESMYGSDATCDDEDLIRAYDYLLSDPDGNGRTIAQETNTRVVNMSLGGYIADDPSYEYDYAFEEKIEQAQDAGILTVAAAGNGDGYGNPRTDASYPSDYEAVMSVIALQSDTQRAYWSDKNQDKNISAPGVDIYSTWYTGNQYHFDSGTSMASPLVAGGAALLCAYNPELTVADVKEALYSTADDLGAVGFDPEYGWGRMNLRKAVESLGTVMVKSERSSMVRTTRQKVTAQVIANAAEEHSWQWSVSDSSKARITEDGVLTALAAGSVEVQVVATDDAKLSGKKTVDITEIEVPGGITASANPAENTIAVRWAKADGATEYRVERARSEKGPFAQVAVIAASESDSEGVTYLDRTARPSVEYWYRLVPAGTLDGQAVRGEATSAVRCYYTDKSSLKAAVQRAESLLSETRTSADGADVPASEYWATSDEKLALNRQLRLGYNAYYSGSLMQEGVDQATSDLAAACDDFESKRALGKKASETPQDPQQGKAGDEGAERPAQSSQPSQPSKSDQPVKPAQQEQTSGQQASSGSASQGSAAATEPSAPSSPAATPTPTATTAAAASTSSAKSVKSVAMHCLYLKRTGEHVYTSSAKERRRLVKAGWRDQGVAWKAPVRSSKPVFKLRNPYTGGYHYTTGVKERNRMMSAGWRYKAIGWYSDKAKGRPVYRLFNPHKKDVASHYYTTSKAERKKLVKRGWRYEGVAWYGVK